MNQKKLNSKNIIGKNEETLLQLLQFKKTDILLILNSQDRILFCSDAASKILTKNSNLLETKKFPSKTKQIKIDEKGNECIYTIKYLPIKWQSKNYKIVFFEKNTILKASAQANADYDIEKYSEHTLLFRKAKDGILIFADGMNIIDANQSFADMLGYTLEEAKKSHIWDWDVNFPSKEEVENKWPEFPKNPYTIETRHRRKDGSIFDVEISVTPTKFNGVNQAYCICRDISERKKAEKQINKRELEFRTLAENIPAIIVRYDRNCKAIFVNRKLDPQKYTDIKIIGKTPLEHGYKEAEGIENYEFKIKHVIETGEQQTAEISIPDLFGNIHIHEINIVAEWNTDGEIIGALAIGVDVTERRKTEKNLKESEQRFRTVADFTNDWEYWIGPDGNLLYVSPSCEHITGFKPEDYYNNPKLLFDIIHPDDIKISEELLDNNSDKSSKYIFRIVSKNQDMRWIEHIGQPVYDSNGEKIGRRVSNRDITLQKITELELYKNQGMLTHILNSVPQAIFWKDKNSIYLGCNKIFAEKAGFQNPKDIIGKTDYDLPWQKEDTEAYRKDDKDVIESNCSKLNIVEQLRSQNGTHLWIETSKVPLTNDNGEVYGILGVFDDITEKKKFAEQRQLHLKFFENMDKVNKAIQGSYDIEKMMNNVLETIFTIFDCDRAWLLFPCDPDAPSYRVPMEITRPEYPGAKQLNVAIPTSAAEAATMREALSSDGPVTYTEGTDREIVTNKAFNVKSQMFIPLYPKIGKPWILGIHQCSYARVWNSEDRILFKEISRRITDGLSTLLLFKNLKESEEKYRGLIDNMREGIYLVDKEGKINFANNALAKIYGVEEPDQLLGKYFWDFMEPAASENIKARFYSIIQTAKAVDEMETSLVKEDGKRVYILNRPKLILKDSKVTGVSGIIQDITERKIAEVDRIAHTNFVENMDKVNRAIQSAVSIEEMMNNVLKLTLFIFDCDRAWLLYPSNPKGASFKIPMEHTKPQYPGALIKGIEIPIDEGLSKAFEILHESDGPVSYGIYGDHPLAESLKRDHEVKSQLSMIIQPKGDKSWQFGLHQCEYDRKWSNEEKRIFQEIGRRLTDGLTGLLAYRKLEESEQRYRLIAENTADTISVFDMNLRHIYVSPSVLNLTGFTTDEIMSKNLEKILTKESYEKVYLEVSKQLQLEALEGSDPHRTILLELEENCKNGSTIWIELAASILRDDNLKPKGILTVTRDITARKKSENELRRLMHAIEQSTVSVIITNTSGEIEYVNPVFTRNTGYSKEEVVGKNPRILKSGDTNPDQYQELWNTISSGKEWRGEFHNRKKDGELFWEAASISPVLNEKGIISNFVAIKEDITEQKRIQKALRESEEQYRKLVKTVPDIIIKTELNGNIVFVNDALQITRYSPAELLGKNVFDFISSEDKDRALLNTKLMFEQPLGLKEYKIKVENNFEMDCEINGDVLRDLNGDPYGMVYVLRDISKRKQTEMELEKYRLHLEELIKERTIELENVNALLQEEILKQKEAEQKVKQALEKEKELSDLKTKFISITSHEFKTPLTTILSSTELLERYGRNWELEKYFVQTERIKKSIQYLTNLLDDVLLLSKADTGRIVFNPQKVDLSKLCFNLFEDLKLLNTKNNKFEYSYNVVYESLYLDEKLIKHILINLLSNAIKYSFKDGKISFIVNSYEKEIEFEIRDEGIGIPEEDQPSLFETFNRAKNVGDIHGTGLGLSIVKRSVELHGGSISFKSKVGVGTCISVKIPIRYIG